MREYLANIKQSFKIKHYVNYILVLLPLLLFTVLHYAGALNRSTPTLLVQIGYSMILAVSLNLVVGFLGELSLGHAGFMCVGAYLGSLMCNALVDKLPLMLVLILGMLVGGVAAALFGFIVGLPPLRLRGDYLAIVTLAFCVIIRNICKNLEFLRVAKGLETKWYSAFLAVRNTAMPLFIPTFIVALLMLALIQNLIRSKHGRAITAIRDNEIAAKAMGINVTYYKLFVFVISAFFAGMAGVIYAGTASPIQYSFFSYNYSIEILVMVVLGGMGSIRGSIISAALITYINFVLKSNLSGDMAAVKTLVYALILILMVIYKNAPALKPVREKFNLKLLGMAIREKLFNIKHDAATVTDDAGEWDEIPTKIITDEVLSTDLALTNYNPDKPDSHTD